MESKLFLFLILFYSINGEKTTITSTNSSTYDIFKSPLIATTSPPQDNYLESISIQDVLSSDIDASEKIEKKIINAITEYSSNCRTYKKIHLSTKGFSFPGDPITVELNSGENAVFSDIRVSESPQNDSKTQSNSTLIGCDSSRIAKVEVKLPNSIVISADLQITKITISSSGFQPVSDILDKGSISFTLMYNAISKQFPFQMNNSTNYENNIASKILYKTSEVSLNIDTKFQMEIYNNLKTWFDEVESHIKQHLIEKLDVEMTNNGISIADSCSKFITPDKNGKKVNSPFFNNNLNNLYVIPNAKLETWKGINLSAGPIVIDGLSSFNSTELIVLESKPSIPEGNYGHYFIKIPQFDDPEINSTTVRIKTNDLKGKVDWSYNSKQRSFPFTLEFIQFEIKKSKSFIYSQKYRTYEYQNGRDYYYPSGSYVRSSESKMDMKVYLGNLQIKSSKSSVCENENEFVRFVLSEYLKTIIVDSLKNSLSQKLLNDSLFANCP